MSIKHFRGTRWAFVSLAAVALALSVGVAFAFTITVPYDNEVNGIHLDGDSYVTASLGDYYGVSDSLASEDITTIQVMNRGKHLCTFVWFTGWTTSWNTRHGSDSASVGGAAEYIGSCPIAVVVEVTGYHDYFNYTPSVDVGVVNSQQAKSVD